MSTAESRARDVARKRKPETAELVRALKKRHYEQNKDSYLARAAYRQAMMLHRTVPWADKAAIAAIYAEARRLSIVTGIPHEVDHTVPLQGEFVCGLHVETNLQILTAAANKAKANKWDPI